MDNPALDSAVDRWWLLLHYAVMAPSGHNTQPWLFRLRGDTAELRQDRSRALPVVDPQGREMVMSCGAALFNLRLAIRHFGLEDRTTLLPDPVDPDLLARVHLSGEAKTRPAQDNLFSAIAERRTNRMPFEPGPVPEKTLAEIESAAVEEGAWLVLLRAAADRKRVAELIARGDQIQASQPELRAELAAWVRSNGSARRDGLRGYSFGHGRLASLFAPWYIKYGRWGDAQAEADEQLASSAPVLAVLGTDADERLDWLRAGQALSRVLLAAQADGITASFFNQPIEVAELRDRLRAEIGASGFPQMCFRLGRGKPMLPSPRRPVEEVIVNE